VEGKYDSLKAVTLIVLICLTLFKVFPKFYWLFWLIAQEKDENSKESQIIFTLNFNFTCFFWK